MNSSEKNVSKKEEELEDANLPKALTVSKEENFGEWYNQVISLAEIVDRRYAVKGMFVWLPYGIEIIHRIKDCWDSLFKESGIKEMYFPLIVPVQYAEQNIEWWEGFKTQVFWVKGFDDEDPHHILRPTGEPAMYPMFSLWIRTHANLPWRIYQTVSSFRYESKMTRSLIRDREITFWYEIHTVHSTKEEAEKEIQEAIRLNDSIYNFLAVAALKVLKPPWESFPGSIGAIEYYTLIPNERVLENGSINNLGQAYARRFDIRFKTLKVKISIRGKLVRVMALDS